MELQIKARKYFTGSKVKQKRKRYNKATDIDLDLLSPRPEKLCVAQKHQARERLNVSKSVTEDDTRENYDIIENKFTREDLKYELAVVRLMTWLRIIPVEFDEDSGRIWLPPQSCKWRGRMANTWNGLIGTRIVSIVISLIYNIGMKEKEGEFALFQQMLETVHTFVLCLLFIGYCSVAVWNMPSQTILSNHIYDYIGKRKSSLSKL